MPKLPKFNILSKNGRKTIKNIENLDLREVYILFNENQNTISSLETFSFFQKSELRKDFQPVFGKPHGFIDGKYKKAAVYVFTEKDTDFLCIIEPGDRGTGWYVVDDNLSASTGMLYMDDDFMLDKFIPLLSKINYEINGQHLPLDILPVKSKQTILSIISNEEKEYLSAKIKKTGSPGKPSIFKKI